MSPAHRPPVRPLLRLAASLALFWHLRDHMPEGRQRLERALARPEQSRPARMRALAVAGWLAHWLDFEGDRYLPPNGR